jgi:mono/diheme cytochrome c family protein
MVQHDRSYVHPAIPPLRRTAAKIGRGGTGTGMPGWGDIYTARQTWSLVAFLRTLTFPDSAATP